MVCVCMCVWMNKCLQGRNVAKWPALPVSYSLPAGTQTMKKKYIFFKKKVAHFTLIYIGYWRLGSHRPVCDSSHPDSLQLQQGLFELFRQFVCTDTSGDGERKEDRKKKKQNPPLFHFGTFPSSFIYYSYPPL